MMDTVRDLGTAGATGFHFDGEQVGDMANAIRRALHVFNQPPLWQTLQNNGMRTEFSWAAPAKEYVSMYGRLTSGAVQQAFLRASTEEKESVKVFLKHLEPVAKHAPKATPTTPATLTHKPAAARPVFVDMKVA